MKAASLKVGVRSLGIVMLGATLAHCRPPTAGEPNRESVNAASASSGIEAPGLPSPALSSSAARPTQFDGGPPWCANLASLPPDSNRNERSRRFLCVQLSMSQDQVRGLLGPPDQVERRAEGDLFWRYAGAGPKGAEAVGYVAFGPSNEVTSIQTPIPRMTPQVHRANRAVPSPAGMRCDLQGVAWKRDALRARVILRNNGKSVFRFQHDHTAIKFNLLVSIFDDHDVLIAEQDWGLLHSPYGDMVELVIAPGGESGEDVTFPPMMDGEIRHLAPGHYSLQVAFPFHPGEFYASDRVPFVVVGSGGKPPTR
jgi:hypothetical protein